MDHRANLGRSPFSNQSGLRLSSAPPAADPAVNGITMKTSTDIDEQRERHGNDERPVHQQRHDRSEQEQHDESFSETCDQRVGGSPSVS